ncbi:MAG: glycosyltransferase family 2 protein [Thermodesulfobacteriota bacterium]
MGKRCIVIPALDEADRIGSVIEGIRRHTEADIVVVDDGSRDRTARRARSAGALVIRHPFNMGYGVALQTGYKYALKQGYDVLVQMDGDGQHDPHAIPALFQEVESGECDVALGSRFLVQGGYPVDLLKALGIGFFRGVIRVLTGRTVTDPTSGYQCLGRRAFEFFSRGHFPWRYPDANVVLLLHRMGFSIKEVPARMMPNPAGRSMHRGVFTLAYYFIEMFLSLFVTLLRNRDEGLAGNQVPYRDHSAASRDQIRNSKLET